MNYIFYTKNHSVIQIRLFVKNIKDNSNLSFYHTIESWGTGIGMDLSLFGYHILNIAVCTHCRCNKRGCKHNVKSSRRRR